MTNPLSRSTRADEPDFKAIKQRFLGVNRARLQRTLEALHWHHRDVLDLLPLLFHTNHPLLPGFVSKQAPAGIPDYSPSQAALRAAKTLSKSFAYKKRSYRVFDIQALYLMGSTGTIAYAEGSDLDVWACYDGGLSVQRQDILRTKADRIESWAREQALDLHIFLVDAAQFRRGEHGTLTHESSGSMQHHLLLDEFYRTSLLLAGRYPLWWLVPPEQENHYDDYAAEIKRRRFVHAREHIDFGSPAGITRGEFYAASLWLLYKGIDSPYKAVLKIQLMEVYASEHPQIDLLSLRFKHAIYQGETALTALDPYLAMMRKVEEYLQGRHEKERLDLARRCLYFKVNAPLGAPDNPRSSDWRREALGTLVRGWGWSHSRLMMLDARPAWKVRRVSEARRELVTEFTRSYRYLSRFVRQHADAPAFLRPSDLNMLGRKLYAAFERKTGKIEIIIRGITRSLHETHLSIHQHTDSDGLCAWMVFSGVVPPEELGVNAPLKRAHGLLELLAWCFFNRIVEASTVIALFTPDSDITLREARALVDHMQHTFPTEVLELTDMTDLACPARIAAIATYINVGTDPFAAYTRRGHHLTSARTDALKYGGLFENLALTLDQLIVTSWQEVLTFRYTGVEGLMDCISDYLRWSPPSSGHRPPPIVANSFSSGRGGTIARRVASLFEDVLDCYYDANRLPDTRYLVGVEREYYILRLHNDTLGYQRIPSYSSLLLYLSTPQPRFSPMLFDAQTLEDSVLPHLYARNRTGKVQFYYQVVNDEAEIFVLDERGSLYHQHQPFHDASTLLTQFERFFEAVRNRLNLLARECGLPDTDYIVEYHRILRQGGDWRFRRQECNPYVPGTDYFELQAIGNETRLTLYCDDAEFSYLEYGEAQYRAVAQYVLARRSSHLNYPIYLTDVDLPRSVFGEDGREAQTIYFLNYKKTVEDELNTELLRAR